MLAGSAVAGRPTAHTLRKSPGGPIAAIAENNSVAAWFTASTKGCNLVHILSPGKHDRSLPQPSSLTCHWSLKDGQPQLAVAARMSTALWTLHESSPSLDMVMAASIGEPERQLAKLAHASDGTGKWLEGVAGAGRTLAYSWDDVEYVDPDACLSRGMCKQKIADGGIRLVTRTDDTALPGTEPALQLAAAAGRLAYVPATTVKAGRPTVSLNNTLRIVDAVTGDPVGQALVKGIPIAIALPEREVTLLEANGRKCDFLREWAPPNATVAQGRAEEQETDVFGVAVAKALAPPPVAAEWCLPLVRPGGVAILWIGPTADAGRVARVAEQLGGELGEDAGGLLVLRKLEPTPSGFPRRPGMARKRSSRSST